MSKLTTTAWATAAVLLAASAANAAVIFQDSFGGFGGPLNGTTPTITTGGEVWEAGSSWLDDGTAGTTVAGGPDGQAAHLDFTPLSGRIYTAEATILNNQPNWIGFGFMSDNPPAGDWTQTSFSVRHSTANVGYAWLLTRASTGNDQEGFLGSGTGGGQSWNGDVTNPANPIRVKVVLNTLAANWTSQWFINGNAMGAAVAYGVAGNPGIGGIGFSHDRNATANNGGSIANFSLTEVPEPSTLVLVLLGVSGALGLARRR